MSDLSVLFWNTSSTEQVAELPAVGIPYPLLLSAALLPWQNFAGALQESSNCLIMNANRVSTALIEDAPDLDLIGPGDYEAVCEIAPPYVEGRHLHYRFSSHFVLQEFLHGEYLKKDALIVQVSDPMDARSNRYCYGGTISGVVRPMHKWKIQQIQR